MYIWFTMCHICVKTCGTDTTGIQQVASRHLSTCVYKPFIVQGLSASTVHICIIRLLLKPRDLPREDGGTEVKVKACESVGQVVDTHWPSMLLAILKCWIAGNINGQCVSTTWPTLSHAFTFTSVPPSSPGKSLGFNSSLIIHIWTVEANTWPLKAIVLNRL